METGLVKIEKYVLMMVRLTLWIICGAGFGIVCAESFTASPETAWHITQLGSGFSRWRGSSTMIPNHTIINAAMVAAEMSDLIYLLFMTFAYRYNKSIVMSIISIFSFAIISLSFDCLPDSHGYY